MSPIFHRFIELFKSSPDDVKDNRTAMEKIRDACRQAQVGNKPVMIEHMGVRIWVAPDDSPASVYGEYLEEMSR